MTSASWRIDGTWRRDCLLNAISDNDATLTVEGSIQGLNLKEFFLLLSSTGLAYRRCELVRVNGTEIDVSLPEGKAQEEAAGRRQVEGAMDASRRGGSRRPGAAAQRQLCPERRAIADPAASISPAVGCPGCRNRRGSGAIGQRSGRRSRAVTSPAAVPGFPESSKKRRAMPRPALQACSACARLHVAGRDVIQDDDVGGSFPVAGQPFPLAMRRFEQRQAGLDVLDQDTRSETIERWPAFSVVGRRRRRRRLLPSA